MKKSYLAAVLFLALSLFNTALYGMANVGVKEVERYESLTLSNTQLRHIESQYTHKTYRIYVDIPAGYYQHPDKTYPALFLLDADYSFPIAKAVSEHLEDRNRVPEFFIFGIAYEGPKHYKLNRTQDYTPTFVADGGYGPQYQKVSGGGPKFEKFLQKELIPYLSQAYRLNADRTLVGHSYGGLFASWLMLKHPGVFHNYIIVSPSLWYDKHFIFKLDKQYLKRQPSPLKIFFGIGSKENDGEYRMIDDLNYFVEGLEKIKNPNVQTKFIIFPYEDHDTIFPTALTQGVMYIYKKW